MSIRHYILTPGTAAQTGGWVNPNEGKTQNNTGAYITGDLSQSTNKLILTNMSGGPIPDGAVVKGFAARLRSAITGGTDLTVGGDTEFNIWLTKNASAIYGVEPLQFFSQWCDMGIGPEVPITPPSELCWVEEVVGSASWKFMTTLPSVAEINNSNFGIIVEANTPDEYDRDHSGVEPTYSTNTPRTPGVVSWLSNQGLFVDIAQLIVFVEFDDIISAEGDCDGTVDIEFDE